MAYATPAELIQVIDVRAIGDLCEDNNVRVTPTQILSDPNVIFSLSAAAGQINASVLVGNRYTPAQLLALQGDDLNFLIVLNCWLAFGLLCQRRGRDATQRPEYKSAQAMLKNIEMGMEMFNVGTQGQLPSTNFMTQIQWATVNTLRSATPKFFPIRRDQNTVT